MATWRFVPAADLHMDSPFVGLKNYQEKLTRDLMEDTFTAFHRLRTFASKVRRNFASWPCIYGKEI